MRATSERGLYNAEIFFYKSWRPKGLLNLKSSYMSQLLLSASFENLCYGSTAIIHKFFLVNS